MRASHRVRFWTSDELRTTLFALVASGPKWLFKLPSEEVGPRVREEVCSQWFYWPVFKAGGELVYSYDIVGRDDMDFVVEIKPQHCLFLWFRSTSKNLDVTYQTKERLGMLIDMFALTQGSDLLGDKRWKDCD